MSKTFVIVAMLLLLATTAMASETSWRMWLRADSGAGMNSGAPLQVGVYPTSSDLRDAEDQEFDFATDVPGNTADLLACIPGQSGVFYKSIQAASALPKVWDLYLAANHKATYSQLRLTAYTVRDALPPTARYYLTMMDNRGMAGAPANGTRWNLPIPTAHSTSAYWVSPVNLPVTKLSAPTAAALFSEGYRLRFVQEIIPEPSGIVALAACLFGAAGSALRRRRP